MGQHARQSGFSLFELMTTLAIAGIGLSLAVPGLQSIVADNRRTTAINAMVSSLHVARSTAITRNEPVAICPSTSGKHCDAEHWEGGWILFTDADRDLQVGQADQVVGTGAMISGLEIESAEFRTSLAYRPSGQLLVDTRSEPRGEFHFCDPRGAEFSLRLVIGAAGKPRLDNGQQQPSASLCNPD